MDVATRRALLLRPEQVARVLNIGRSKVFDLIRSGQLRSVKAGGSRRISASALREYVARLESGENESGRPIWRGNLNKLIDWKAAVGRIGQPHLHFHDLRHTGNTLAAPTGASTRDLMARMGHDSSQAALIYQHATAEADRAIA